MCLRLITVVIASVLLFAGAATAQSNDACPQPFTPADARSLYEELRSLGLRSDCRLSDFNVDRARLKTTWATTADEHVEMTMVPRACGPANALSAGELAVLDPNALQTSCPGTFRELDSVLSASRSRAFGTGEQGPDRKEGRLVLGLAAVALISFFGWWFVRRRRSSWDWRWFAVSGGGFLLALIARLTITPALSNWYAEVASARVGRFGPVAFAFQEACQSILPRSDRSLLFVHALVGALTIPVFVLTLRALGTELRAALGVAVLFSLASLHIRVSASPSEHVLSAALTLLALFLWTSGAKTAHWLPKVCALCLVPAAALTRPDALPQLAIIPLWGLFAAPPKRRWLDPVLFSAVWVIAAVATWYLVVIPSKHPTPSPDAIGRTARMLFTQFWTASTVPPGWFSLTATLLGAVGAVYAAVKHRWLLLLIAASLAICFVPLGRSLAADGLVGSRYFQAAIPIALVLSGLGFAAACSLANRAAAWLLRGRPRVLQRVRPWLAVALAVLLGTTVWWRGRSARAFRYAFQDEYDFLRSATEELDEGCTVLQLPLRRGPFQRDLDCCLDAPRSPLVIARPNLKWRYLEPGRGLPTASSDTCIVYYEGAACSLADTATTQQRNPEALRWFREHCGPVRETLGTKLFREQTVSSESTTGILGDHPVTVRLYRVERSH